MTRSVWSSVGGMAVACAKKLSSRSMSLVSTPTILCSGTQVPMLVICAATVSEIM